MKQSLVLEIIEHLATCGKFMFLNVLFAPYNQGLGQALRDTDRVMANCTHDFSRYPKESVSVTLSRLRKRRLVNKKGPNKRAVWTITKKGFSYFRRSTNKLKPPKDDGKIRFVVFDIPEKYRSSRSWLRTRLMSCDYTLFQKSVWLGTRPLPEELLDELKERDLSTYVHVVGLDSFIEKKGV
jgi:DNA-binding transcriptional regulator PaaX